jgi:hypothetical protein
MLTEIISHFFLLPQKMPVAISFSISGWRVVEAHVGDCWAVCRSRARTTAELPTDQPRASEASWLSCLRMVWASWVSVWERTTRGCFFGVGLRRAIQRDHISLEHEMIQREQIVTRANGACGVSAQCLYSSFDSDLSWSLKRHNSDVILQ